MLKRSKIDDSGPGGGSTVAVVNDDRDAAELIARLVESTGRRAARLLDLADVEAEVATSDDYGSLVIDSLHCGIEAAMVLLEQLRGSSEPGVRSLPVVILAASDANRLYAFQTGADGFLVRPFHAEDLIAELDTVLGRSADEREQFRQQQLLAG